MVAQHQTPYRLRITKISRRRERKHKTSIAPSQPHWIIVLTFIPPSLHYHSSNLGEGKVFFFIIHQI